MPRFIPEETGAVHDTKTGLREWFETHREAIEVAARRNAAWAGYVAHDGLIY